MPEFGSFFKDFVDDEKANMDIQSQRISFAWHLNPEVLPQYSNKLQEIQKFDGDHMLISEDIQTSAITQVKEFFDKKDKFNNTTQVDHFIIDFKPNKVFDLLRRYRMLNGYQKSVKLSRTSKNET
jgi:hypothetical protein